MSTILKALRRLEEEKASAEEPRPLREQIASERQIERPARRGWLAAIVALVLGVGAGGGAIWWLFRGESGGAAPPVVAQATPQPVSAPVAVAAPPVAPIPAAEPDRGPPEQAFESDVEIIPRPDVGPRLTDDTPIEPVIRAAQAGSHRPVESSAAAERARQAAIAEAEAAAAARENRPVAAEPPPPPVVPHVAEVPTPLPPPPAEQPVEVRLPAPPPPAAAAKKAPTPGPAVAKAKPASSPPAPRPVEKAAAPPPPANLPQLEVEKTQWHPLPERRIAWLHVSGEGDSRKVKEGDVVDGLVVAKIEPSGVVFERGGEQFHRGVGKR